MIAAIDVAVLPNAPDYCSPLKIFEYMAMAKAIVAPATRTICGILTDGEEALLFPPGDYKSMVQAILRLAGDPALRNRLGLAARQRVCEQFSWRHNSERVYDLLEKVWQCYMQAQKDSS
jgi:glycosyltransferase involved in cell wall biosynthesis